MNSLQELNRTLAEYRVDDNFQDDRLGYRCCELAMEALNDKCYGVGAVLFDSGNNILSEGRNEVFLNGFHSGRHAEMIALDNFEKRFPTYTDRCRLTLIVSLEPCPMCFTRTLFAGIGHLVYLAEDPNGGMVRRLTKMPAVWRNLARLQHSRQADVSPVLSQLASQIGKFELAEKRRKLLKTIRA